MYNGHKNYETWNFSLHINNDQGLYNMFNDEAKEIYEFANKDDHFTRFENACFKLQEFMKEFIDNNTPELNSFYADILQANLSEIETYDIAKDIMQEIQEEFFDEWILDSENMLLNIINAKENETLTRKELLPLLETKLTEYIEENDIELDEKQQKTILENVLEGVQ
jgi:hypothetical protein